MAAAFHCDQRGNNQSVFNYLEICVAFNELLILHAGKSKQESGSRVKSHSLLEGLRVTVSGKHQYTSRYVGVQNTTAPPTLYSGERKSAHFAIEKVENG